MEMDTAGNRRDGDCLSDQKIRPYHSYDFASVATWGQNHWKPNRGPSHGVDPSHPRDSHPPPASPPLTDQSNAMSADAFRDPHQVGGFDGSQNPGEEGNMSTSSFLSPYPLPPDHLPPQSFEVHPGIQSAQEGTQHVQFSLHPPPSPNPRPQTHNLGDTATQEVSSEPQGRTLFPVPPSGPPRGVQSTFGPPYDPRRSLNHVR
jgi:hypothetical protein